MTIRKNTYIIPEQEDSSHMPLRLLDSRFVHPHSSAYLQGIQHQSTTIHRHFSQPMISTVWTVSPGHKSLLPNYTCGLWDNSAPCLNSRRPATVVTTIMHSIPHAPILNHYLCAKHKVLLMTTTLRTSHIMCKVVTSVHGY